MIRGCLIVVLLVAAVSAQKPQCVDNITAAIGSVADAGINIAQAVFDCSQHKTDQCIGDISNCGANLASAGVDISKAVTACGGAGSKCATDLLQLGKDLATASEDVAQAAQDCTNSTRIIECVVDVSGLANNIHKIVSSIVDAAGDCKSNQTRV